MIALSPANAVELRGIVSYWVSRFFPELNALAEIPKSKTQIPNQFQSPKFQPGADRRPLSLKHRLDRAWLTPNRFGSASPEFGAWELGVCLGFGFWDLDFSRWFFITLKRKSVVSCMAVVCA
jgi:hypothetical protein